MIEIIKPREKVIETYYRREFQHLGSPVGCGYEFDIDENKNVIFNHPTQKKNYEYCITHPEIFIDNGIVEHEDIYFEPAIAICECGEEIELTGKYLGASECPYCGLWHNMSGQTLKNPEEW